MSDTTPPFLVTIATQRSGTKFLGTAFSAGALVRSRGEAFQPGGPARFGAFFAEFAAQRGSFGFESGEVVAMLDAFVARLSAEVAPALLHIDLMYNNLGAFSPVWSLPGAAPRTNLLLTWLRHRGAGVIHLVRPDLAECLASHVIAESRGVYHTGNAEEAARDISVTIGAEQATAYMLPILRARRFVREALAGYPRMVELTYPSFIDGQTVAAETATRLARLVGLPPGSAANLFGASPLRQTAPDKRGIVTNFDDIARLARLLEQDVAAA
ncbi:hypothetical protein J5Y09_15580 [Roseomonas sp. PWR1]|uniref:Sulphotransferase Stf0 domain-containing protein n=1 Tax=Roseomonas nitratireducens TaxID=2820810 RepID=A0ABS4AVF3_9PROT|nr:hypothetical protein [Neoroseomonas nitratireducens]MBP0465346.1 hypothetical protein [Neoroseomonas nitratireducens]